MHRGRTGHQSVPRPLLVAALLAVLGLLTMHTLVLPSAADASTPPDAGHVTHEHLALDHGDAPHSHPAVEPDARLAPGDDRGSTGHPCGSCPGCDHETTSVCALAPGKAGSSQPLLSVTELAPAPHQLTAWPGVGSPPQATSAPPSLTALSISRT
ncbi:DUF6153 family protein [Pseudactinotalea terrae]|uniref:DUF6153 family protein n=1 Tax=Pseudactinotalea terrae TaxID=1743262 RepID=UPI0012E2446F|nr:DUF6153 family protein [Pseudactinotalea terrae]